MNDTLDDAPTQRELAQQMAGFVGELPSEAGLDWVKDPDFLYHFEASRLLLMRKAILQSGILPNQPLRILDFGYLHGLVPEFLHRFFPTAHITVYDHPGSPNFRNGEYLEIIRRRNYLSLEPRDINDWKSPDEKFDIIVLGELIEHLDPTTVAKVLAVLRDCIKPQGVLVVTTPNGSGLLNALLLLLGREQVVHPPIPDATMNYGHIHLWPPRVLSQTATHYGWKLSQEFYFHGREGELFSRAAQHAGSIRHQVMMWLVKRACEWKPKLRGFYVASFTPGQTE